MAVSEVLDVVLGEDICWVANEQDQLAPAGSEVVDYCCSYSRCSTLTDRLALEFSHVVKGKEESIL